MGYLQTHRGLISDRTVIAPGSALRGRVYELSYDSETATKTKYVVLGINIYPKAGGKWYSNRLEIWTRTSTINNRRS